LIVVLLKGSGLISYPMPVVIEKVSHLLLNQKFLQEGPGGALFTKSAPPGRPEAGK